MARKYSSDAFRKEIDIHRRQHRWKKHKRSFDPERP
jgi:hypothetical protein